MRAAAWRRWTRQPPLAVWPYTVWPWSVALLAQPTLPRTAPACVPLRLEGRRQRRARAAAGTRVGLSSRSGAGLLDSWAGMPGRRSAVLMLRLFGSLNMQTVLVGAAGSPSHQGRC